MSGQKIKVEVNLFANLRKYAPPESIEGSTTMDLDEGITIDELCRQLEIPPSELKQFFVNHVRRGEDYRLQEGDRVSIFPPVAGG